MEWLGQVIDDRRWKRASLDTESEQLLMEDDVVDTYTEEK